MFQRPNSPPIETGIVIIGAGVAGLTLAEYLQDRNIDFWLLGSPYESQLAKAGELDEETPLPKGTVGLKHIEQIMERIETKQVKHRSSLCTGIDKSETGYLVKTKYQNFECSRIVIATGRKQKKLGFDGEKEFFQKGISDCAVCDFPLYKDKPLAVIGNHKYTEKAANFLKKHASNVSLLWYNNDNPPKIDGVDLYSGASDVKVTGEEIVEKISFKIDGKPHEIDVRAVFVEGEPVANTDFLQGLKIELENGYVKINEKYETNLSGIWAIGDVTGQSERYDNAKNMAENLGELFTS